MTMMNKRYQDGLNVLVLSNIYAQYNSIQSCKVVTLFGDSAMGNVQYKWTLLYKRHSGWETFPFFHYPSFLS